MITLRHNHKNSRKNWACCCFIYNKESTLEASDYQADLFLSSV